MGQPLKESAVLIEDPGSVRSNHTVVDSHMLTAGSGNWRPLLASTGSACVRCTDTQEGKTENTLVHIKEKIKFLCFCKSRKLCVYENTAIPHHKTVSSLT